MGKIKFLGILGIMVFSMLHLDQVEAREVAMIGTDVGSQVEINSTYLNNFKYRATTFDILAGDSNYGYRKQQEYNELVRDYELRSTYHLLSRYEESAYQKRIQDYSKSMLTELRKMHTDAETRKMRKNAEKDPNARIIVKPAVVLAGIYAFYSGEKMNWSLSSDTQLTAQTKIEERWGNFELLSPSINGSIFVSQPKASSEATDGAVQTAPDPKAKKADRVRTSVSRAIPVFDLSSAVSYGADSRSFTASLSRPLMPYVTGVVDSTRTLGPSDGFKEETLRVLFGMSF